jgi:hypothetical protein
MISTTDTLTEWGITAISALQFGAEDDDEEYCIVDPDCPSHSLCGQPFDNSYPELPDAEVPDEITCEDCLIIQSHQINP